MTSASRRVDRSRRAGLLALLLCAACQGSEAVDLDDLEAPTPEPPPAGLLPDYPIFTMVAPLRAEDLEPGMVVRISPEPGHRWHDLTVWRWEDGWQGHEPGGTAEQDETDWGLPVYAGIDGEVVDCWRNSPYVEAFEDVADKQRTGGNFLTIRTADDHFVYYAHMDTDSIPPQVCPRASEDGWLDTSQVVDCQLAPRCMTTATYLAPEERPQIRAGQYIGRIGAHGQARGAHLHVHVGYVVVDEGGIINSFDDAPEHLAFTRASFQPQAGSSRLSPFTEAFDGLSRRAMLEQVEAGPTLVWPGTKAPATRPAWGRMHDFDGDGVDDLLCHDTERGTLQLDLARAGAFEGNDWGRDGWCHAAGERLHVGDFDGDGRSDLLCRDLESGSLWIDRVGTGGGLEGTDLFVGANWCGGDTDELHIGDFDGDGRDDLLCHDVAHGTLSLQAVEAGAVVGLGDAPLGHTWCHGHYERLHVGALDDQPGDDLLCHDTRAGTLRLDFARDGTFEGTDQQAGPWCRDGGQQLWLADVTGRGIDALVCFDRDDGSIEIDEAAFEGTDWSIPGEGWCDGVQHRIKLGDVDGDGRDDLLCIHDDLGPQWIDYAAPADGETGIFGGADWYSSLSEPWCGRPEQALH